MTHDPHDSDLLDRLHAMARVEPPFTTPVSTMIPMAVSRGRRRRIAGMASRTVAVAVPVVLVGLVAFTLRPGGYLRNDLDVATVQGSPTVSTSAPSAPSASPSSPEAVEPCRGRDLTATAYATGQEMNQPFTTVLLTNDGPAACTLDGYPELTLFRTNPRLPVGESPPVTVTVTHGSIYQVQDPGAARIEVPVHGHAWFSLGTGLAYASPITTLKGLYLAFDGPEVVAVTGFAQQLNGPIGEPYPVTVTAFAPGTPPTS
jgi:hypothetical protein